MPVVTVNGASNQQFPVSFTTNDAFSSATALAQQINQLVSGGSVATQVYVAGAVVTAPGAGQTGELVISSTGNVVAAGPDAIIVVNSVGPNTVSGSNVIGVNTSVVAGSGGLTFTAAPGEFDTVVAGDASNSITTSTSNGFSSIRTGSGNDQITSLSGTAVIQAGLGTNSIFTGASNNLIVTTGIDLIQAGLGGSGSDTILAIGTGSDSISVAGGNIYFIDAGSVASTLVGGSGSDTVFSSSAGGSYTGGSAGNNTLVGGTNVVGAAQVGVTLQGGGSGDTLFSFGIKSTVPGAVNANPVLIGGPGTETISGLGDSRDLSITGGSGNDIISSGSGNDTITAGTGNATINGGAGNDILRFIAGSGVARTETINQFNSNEKINLVGYAPGAAQSAINSEVVNPTIQTTDGVGSTTLKLSDNTTIVLNGVTNLSPSSFI